MYLHPRTRFPLRRLSRNLQRPNRLAVEISVICNDWRNLNQARNSKAS